MADSAADADADAADAADEPDVDPDGTPAPAAYGRIGAVTTGSNGAMIAHHATQFDTAYRHASCVPSQSGPQNNGFGFLLDQNPRQWSSHVLTWRLPSHF